VLDISKIEAKKITIYIEDTGNGISADDMICAAYSNLSRKSIWITRVIIRAQD